MRLTVISISVLLAGVLIGAGGCDDMSDSSDQDGASLDIVDVSDVASGADVSGDVAQDTDGLIVDLPGDTVDTDLTDSCSDHYDCGWKFRCVDSRCVNTPTCELKETPEGCSSDLDELECPEYGGVWSCDPCPGVDECKCACPAADAGCPCWSEFHCDGDCIFPGEETGDIEPCYAIGYCSEYDVRWGSGCMCLPDDGYPPTSICAC